jgi:hypothetical protein
MPQFLGHRSWNAWNVSLWLWNDEGMYRAMCGYVSRHKNKDEAARAMARDYEGMKTPDGAKLNYTTIRLAMLDT